MQKERTAAGAQSLVCLLLCLLLSLLFLSAPAEEAESLRTEDWKWDPGYVNSFTGSLDLSPWAGSEVTLKAEAEMDPVPEGAEAEGSMSNPVFVIIGGKRIVMLSQKDTERRTAGEEPTTFTCSLRMPEGRRLNGVTLKVTALDAEGKELARAEKAVYASILGGRSGGSVFRIPFEIRTVAAWVAAAAAVLWAFALIRGLRRRTH